MSKRSFEISKVKVIFIFILSVFMALPLSLSSQDIDDPEYKKFIKDNLYLIGVFRGVFGANNYVVSEGGKPFFCIPPKMILNEEKILKEIMSEIATQKNSEKFQHGDIGAPSELVVSSFMARKFPCKSE